MIFYSRFGVLEVTCFSLLQRRSNPMLKEEIIILNRYDMSDHRIARTRVTIDEILMVCPFNRVYTTYA